jgi:hypothetical protein
MRHYKADAVRNRNSPCVARDCQLYLGFLRVSLQTDVREANFLSRVIASDDMLCNLFINQAVESQQELFNFNGYIINSLPHPQLRNAAWSKFLQ